MAEENTITTVFRADISQFSASTQQLNSYVKTVNSEFNEAVAGMGKWSDSTDGLNAKINQLNKILEAEKTKLSSLEKEYDSLTDEQKKNTVQGQKLAIQINNQRATVKKTESEIDRYETSLKELTDAGVKTKKELNDLNKTIDDNGSKAGAVAGKLAKGIAGGVAAVGAAAVGAGVGMFKMADSVSQTGDAIDKGSQKLNISAENYQKLSYAMERSGSSIDDISKGMKTITTELADVENGVDGAGESFSKLGVNMRNADGSMKSSEQILLDSIDALGKMENETQRNALAQEIFGKSASELTPLLNSGADGIKQLMQEAEDYGMVMSDDAVLASATFQDSLTRLQGTMSGLKNNMLGQLLPSLSTITDGFTDMMAGVDGGGEKMAQGVKDLVGQITQMIPKAVEILGTIAGAVLESAPSILKALADGIMGALPQLVPVAVSVVEGLITTIVELFPQVGQYFGQIVGALGDALSQSLPSLIPLMISGIVDLAMSILDNLDVIIDAGINIIMSLADGLLNALPVLIEKIPFIIDKLIAAITQNLPKLIAAGIELVVKLAFGMIQAIPQLLAQLPQIITSIVKGLIEGIPQLIKAGGDLLKGLFEGLLNPEVIWENVKKMGESILNSVKDFFGINSPSKVFENIIGKNLMLGINEGVNDEIGAVQKNMDAAMAKITPELDGPSIGAVGSYSVAQTDSLLAALADLVKGNVSNVYNIQNKFEGMQTTQYALHKSNLELKRILKEV